MSPQTHGVISTMPSFDQYTFVKPGAHVRSHTLEQNFLDTFCELSQPSKWAFSPTSFYFSSRPKLRLGYCETFGRDHVREHTCL